MGTEPWRGAINMILYGLLFEESLDETNAAITASAIIEYRSFGQGPRFFLDAIQEALSSDALIMTGPFADPPHGLDHLRHSEDDMRRFLASVGNNLRSRQPWPPKPEAMQ